MMISFKPLEHIVTSNRRVRLSARIDTGADEQGELAVQLLLGRPSKANHQMLPTGMLGYPVYAKDLLGKWWTAEVANEAVAAACKQMMLESGLNMGKAPALPSSKTALVARAKTTEPTSSD